MEVTSSCTMTEFSKNPFTLEQIIFTIYVNQSLDIKGERSNHLVLFIGSTRKRIMTTKTKLECHQTRNLLNTVAL